MERRSDPGTWFGSALTAVGLITALRLALLSLNRTDLFVDESQYWLWGQNLDFGYYSKPPLIAWLIRLVTVLAGSDSTFWVRMPGAVLHGVTAMILGGLAARLSGGKSALWVAVSYVTTPFAAVGSLLISTDTVMAPCYGLALYAWFRLAETQAARWAMLVGVATGAAFMAKYAGAYFLLGAGLAAMLVPSQRVGWRNGAVLILAFALVIAPNVIWNLTHGLATVHHTMDNIGIEPEDQAAQGPSFEELYDFFTAQFAVFGPILFAAFLAACATVWRGGRDGARAALVLFSLPVLVIVCVQALLHKAYANWAVATYFAGTVLVVPYLLARAPQLLRVSVAINGMLALLLPISTILAPWPDRDGRPLLHRYLGRAELSRQIVAAAASHGLTTVLAENRDVLADLYYTGRASGLQFYANPPSGRPENYYEQTFPLRPNAGPVLYVLEAAPVCGGMPIEPIVRFDTRVGAYAAERFAGYVLPMGCAYAPD